MSSTSAGLLAEPERTTAAALDRLSDVIARLDRVVVAFSGGADSALVAYVATGALGSASVLCATAVSPSLAPEELEDCELLAAEWGLRHVAVPTGELSDPAYVANGLDRCYHCKRELMDVLSSLAEIEHATVVLGVNLDDLEEHRPGQRAAAERGARFPLVEAAIDKQTVREISRHLGLRTSDKPAAACLASRIPHGTPVSLSVLSRVASAESGLRTLGFAAVRVRHYGDTARVEVPVADLPRAVERRGDLVAVLKAAGYRYATLDLEGLRSGNLSATALESNAGPR